MKQTTAIFPGSFDPITKGHVDIVKRAIKLFDTIIIAVGIHCEKKYMFNAETRVQMAEKMFAKSNKIKTIQYDQLTSSLCLEHNVDAIIRGVRNSRDFEYEQTLFFANKELSPNIETIFLSSTKENIFISSRMAKDIILHKGPLEKFLPDEIIHYIK